jgi:hypothetical protein
VDLFGTGKGSVMGCCEHANEQSTFIKRGISSPAGRTLASHEGSCSNMIIHFTEKQAGIVFCDNDMNLFPIILPLGPVVTMMCVFSTTRLYRPSLLQLFKIHRMYHLL